MNYKEKIVDIECDSKRVPVCLVCATCGACDSSQPGYTTNEPLSKDSAYFCLKHGKEVDYYDSPCDDFS